MKLKDLKEGTWVVLDGRNFKLKENNPSLIFWPVEENPYLIMSLDKDFLKKCGKIWRPELRDKVCLKDGDVSYWYNITKIHTERNSYSMGDGRMYRHLSEIEPYTEDEAPSKSFTTKDNGHVDCDSPVDGILHKQDIFTADNLRNLAKRFVNKVAPDQPLESWYELFNQVFATIVLPKMLDQPCTAENINKVFRMIVHAPNLILDHWVQASNKKAKEVLDLDTYCSSVDYMKGFEFSKFATGTCNADENGHMEMPEVGFQPGLVMFIPIHEPEFKVGDDVMVSKIKDCFAEGDDVKLLKPVRGILSHYYGDDKEEEFYEWEFKIKEPVTVASGKVHREARIYFHAEEKDMQLIPKENDLKTIEFDSPEKKPRPTAIQEHRARIELKELEEEKAYERRKESRWCKETNKFIHPDEDKRVEEMLRVDLDTAKSIDYADQYDENNRKLEEENEHGKFMRELIEENRRQFWNARVGS